MLAEVIYACGAERPGSIIFLTFFRVPMFGLFTFVWIIRFKSFRENKRANFSTIHTVAYFESF